MSVRDALERRARRILADPRVRAEPPSPSGSALTVPEPDDLAALRVCAGEIQLEDGTRILAQAAMGPATEWLCTERALEWDADLVVVGERDDLVLVRDLGDRAGGGLLEAPTDGLTLLRRASMDAIGYLEQRLGLDEGPSTAPERGAQLAADANDIDGLERELRRPFYAGAERLWAQHAMRAGSLHARSGDAERALAWFERSCEARAKAAPRGAADDELAAAWRACAAEASKAGAAALATACATRARR